VTPMRFRYSTTDPTQHESDSLPWLPVVLRVGTRAVEAVGLVDSGATVNLAFAWLKQNGVPLIFGQTNFFMEFDACFYRSRLEFDIRPKSPT